MNPTDRHADPTPEPESDEALCIEVFKMRQESLEILRGTLCCLEQVASHHRILRAGPASPHPATERARASYHRALTLEKHLNRFRSQLAIPNRGILDEEADRLAPRMDTVLEELKELVG